MARCAWFCAAVGLGAGPGPRFVRRYCCHIVFGCSESYPFLAMHADHACCALMRSGSLIT